MAGLGTKTNGAVSKRQSAAEKAREARIKLHRDRDARDGRVEVAAAEVFTAQDVLAEADERLAAARAAAAAAIADAEAVHAAATRTGEVAVVCGAAEAGGGEADHCGDIGTDLITGR